MTFPLHPLSINSDGSLMYAIEKAGKTVEQLHAFAKANGHKIEKQGYSFWFTGECVNTFLAA